MAIKVLLVGGGGKVTFKHDINRVGSMLREVYRVQYIKVMLDEEKQLTATAVLKELEHMACDLGPSDTLLLYYSGHGDMGYMVFGEGRRLSAKTIRTFVVSVKNICKVVVVADCCYSGSLLEGVLKLQIGDNDWVIPSNHRERKKEVAEERTKFAHSLQLSSSRSTNFSYFNNKFSIFTYHWTRVVRRAKGNITHKNMILEINEKLAHDFLRGSLVAEQHACLYSDDNQADELFLGGALHTHHL